MKLIIELLMKSMELKQITRYNRFLETAMPSEFIITDSWNTRVTYMSVARALVCHVTSKMAATLTSIQDRSILGHLEPHKRGFKIGLNKQ